MRHVRPTGSSPGGGSTSAPSMRMVGEPTKRSSSARRSVSTSRRSTVSGSRPRSAIAARSSASARGCDGQPSQNKSSTRGCGTALTVRRGRQARRWVARLRIGSVRRAVPSPMPHPPDPPSPGAVESRGAADVLRAGGEVGRDLLAVDWAETGVGALGDWPHSLTTAVRILLTSRFAMWMAWGDELTFFCNAAYRADTLGKKYPWALGRSAREVWAEIWPDIGPRIDAVISSGRATWDEALLLFLERSGYVEETYHTFSYSPLYDDEGAISGMLCVVSEDTDRVIGERHMATLRDLGSDTTTVRTEAEVIDAAVRRLEDDRRSLPFALLYVFDDDGAHARLTGATGIAEGEIAAPAVLDASDAEAAWPVAALAAGGTVLVEDIDRRLGPLPTGAWDEPPQGALVVPLPQQGRQQPYGFLVAALNRYRALDDATDRSSGWSPGRRP